MFTTRTVIMSRLRKELEAAFLTRFGLKSTIRYYRDNGWEIKYHTRDNAETTYPAWFIGVNFNDALRVIREGQGLADQIDRLVKKSPKTSATS